MSVNRHGSDAVVGEGSGAAEAFDAVLLAGVGSSRHAAARAVFARVTAAVRAVCPSRKIPVLHAVTSESLHRAAAAANRAGSPEAGSSDAGTTPGESPAGGAERRLTVWESLELLESAGCRRVVIVPLHLLPGAEFRRGVEAPARAAAPRFERLELAAPLLSRRSRYADVLRRIAAGLEKAEGEELLLVGHGSPHRAHGSYAALQEAADRCFGGGHVGGGHIGGGVHIGCITGRPGFEEVAARLAGANARRVLLSPLLVFPGNHSTRDIAGEGSGSWKSRLLSAGFEVRLDSATLGERDWFVPLYGELLRERVNATGLLAGDHETQGEAQQW